MLMDFPLSPEALTLVYQPTCLWSPALVFLGASVSPTGRGDLTMSPLRAVGSAFGGGAQGTTDQGAPARPALRLGGLVQHAIHGAQRGQKFRAGVARRLQLRRQQAGGI